MANYTGLGFNPTAGLGQWGQQQSVPTTVNDYFTPQTPQLTIPEWKPEQLEKAKSFVDWSVNTSQEEKEKEFDPFYELNKWNQGLRGLDEDELDLWERENEQKTLGQLEDWKERLWKNQKFVQDLGMAAFQNTPDANERDEMYENYLLGKPIIQRYGNQDNIQQLLSLTPEGKKELLKSDYKNDWQLKEDNKQDEDKSWFDYSLGERWNALSSQAVSQGATGAGIGSVVGTSAGTPLFGVGAVAGGILGGAFGGASGMISGAMTGLAHPEDAEEINQAKRKTENDGILNKIITSDNERKKAESSNEINDRWSKYLNAYQNGQLSEEQINEMYNNIALSGKRTQTDELGNEVETEYQGSNYYTAFKDEDEFEHFGPTQKLKYIAQTEVLANKYGQGAAIQALEQDMQNYISDNQTGWTWAGNTLKNIWVGGLANLGMKYTALGAMAAKTFYGDEGLANYLSGKDASGNGEENDIFNNINYWHKVDQYNDLGIDMSWLSSSMGDHLSKAEQNGGLSTSTNVVTAGTENDFWSWNTLNAALQMSKFAWSDLITNVGLQKMVGAATKLAGGVELAPGVLATESTAAAQAINKAGAFGILNASSLGIDAAYGMQTFEEVKNQNNAKLDKLIEKDTEAEVQRRIQTPQAKMEFQQFVDAENARRKQRAGETGKWIPVDGDEAWQDYVEHTRKQVMQEQEALHAEDRQQALNDAAKAYMMDASIEHLRMATTNGIFKSYLFDKGTLNALRLNNPYVNVTTKNGVYALGKNATRKAALGTLGTQVWGGFHSNYFDDVTVGYAKGFGIQDYNNYLLQKYNPAAYGSVMDDYVNPFLTGLAGATNALTEKRSVLDGVIGALGAPLTFMPNVPGMINHAERMKQATEAAEKAGKKGNPMSGWEIVSDYINNPIIQAWADAKQRTRMTEEEIKRVNQTIKDNQWSFDNIVEAVSALNQKAVRREGTSALEAEDAKDQEAFALATTLLSLKNSGVTVNAQAEPGKANWSRKKKAANAIGKALNAMLGVQAFEPAGSPYQRAMQSLEDAASIDEMPMYLEQDNQVTDNDSEELQKVRRQSQLVQTFLGLDQNKNVLENMSEEEKIAFAQERLKKNATNLLDMMNRAEEVQQKFEKSLGVNMHPDLKQQLMYQYALDSRWKNRLEELEQQITGEENPLQHQNQESAAIAKYGSMQGYQRALKTQQKRLEDAQKALDKASQEAKKDNDPTKSIAENARLKAFRLFAEKAAKSNLEKEQTRLTQIEAEEASLKNALESGMPIVMADDILRLNADDRLRMLDDYYRNDYSEEQQREIDKAKNRLMEDGTPINQAMERVRDAAILNHRIEDNMEVARRIMQNPVEASNMQQALVENRRRAVMDYFNDKVVAEAFLEFTKDPESTISEENVIKKVSNYSTALLNGMQKMASKEMKKSRGAEDMSDNTLDNIIKGIDAVLKERNNKLKETAELDKYLRKTKKVDHTETEAPYEAVNPETGDITILPGRQVTTEREILPNDRKLLNFAMDYMAEKGLPIEQMAQQVATDDFQNYVNERNHNLTVEDRANQVSPEYMTSLVNDVVDAFKTNKDKVAETTKDKTTANKPVSVATKPVETQGAKPNSNDRDEGDRRPDEPKIDASSSNIFAGMAAQPAATAQPATAIPEAAPSTSEAPKNTTVAKSVRNQEILETAETLNSSMMDDVNTLLNEVDKMQMPNQTREKLKDIIQAQLASKAFQNIQQLQNAVMSDAMTTNQTEAPQIANKATALQGLNIQAIREKVTSAPAQTETTGKSESTNTPTSPLTTPAPMEMSTMDLDLFIDNPKFAPQSTYIKNHNIVSFLQRLFDFWRGDYEKAHKGQVVFIYDDALAAAVQNNIQQTGGMYVAEMAAPIVMALEITDANKHLVEDQSQLIAIKDVSDNKTIRYYQPLGFMPANDNQYMQGTAMRMSALRDAVNFEQKGPQILRYKGTSSKRNGGPIQTNISSMQSHTEEENIPHGTENTPISSVQQLMEDNAMTPTESLVSSTEEERQAYQDAKQKGDGKALRATSLYKKLRDAFISRIFKKEREAANPDDPNAKEINFRVQKGSNDTYPKIVLTKKIRETLDKNTGRPIVDLLREVTDDGANAKEVIESNSRIKRLFNQLSKLSLSKGLFNADGSVANQTMFRSKIAEFEQSVKSAIENNFTVDNLSVKVAVGEGRPSEKLVYINVYSGEPNVDNLLAGLETGYSGSLSEAEFATFMRDLILDAQGNVRQGINDSRFERVKWQVNYEDAERANDKSLDKKIRETAMNNLKDLYDDGIFEMQMTKIAYPARNVTVAINPKMKGNLWTATKAEPEKSATTQVTEQLPVGETETATGAIVEGDSGIVVETPTRESVISGLPMQIWAIVGKMISDSSSRQLTDDGTHYNIMGQLWSRVTSIKYALENMSDRFNPNNGWALPSSLIGNSFDEFGRDVFNRAFDKMTDEERMAEFEGYDNSTAKNYSEGFMSLKAFESRLLEKGQVVIATGNRENPGHITAKGLLDVTVRGENGQFTTKKVRVAGTLDVLAVDAQGNFHIYDFKTHRGAFDKAHAVEKGYDRQLSMYAKFLEDEYGIKVKSINIIPIKADYPTPSGRDNEGNSIRGAEKTYKQSRPGSNQLEVKDPSADDSRYEQFKGANFLVEKEFSLDRLSDKELTASFDLMSEAEKESIVEALQDQSETPSKEITKTDEIINSKPEISETPAEEEEEGLSLKGGKRFGLKRKTTPTSESKVDISPEGTVEAINPSDPISLKNRLDELRKNCGGKK